MPDLGISRNAKLLAGYDHLPNSHRHYYSGDSRIEEGGFSGYFSIFLAYALIRTIFLGIGMMIVDKGLPQVQGGSEPLVVLGWLLCFLGLVVPVVLIINHCS